MWCRRGAAKHGGSGLGPAEGGGLLLCFTRRAPRSRFGVRRLVGVVGGCSALRSLQPSLLTPGGLCAAGALEAMHKARSHQLMWRRLRAHGGCPKPHPAKAQRGARSPSARVLSSSPAITSGGGWLTPSSRQCMQPPPNLFLLPRPLIAARREQSAACPALLQWHCHRGVGQQRAGCISLLPCPTRDGCSAQPSQGGKSPFGSGVM